MSSDSVMSSAHKLMSDVERALSASLIRIRLRSPFFATLALFTTICPTRQVAIAATDGQRILLNPDCIDTLSSLELDGLIVHEVLHTALLHVFRRGQRDPMLWNMAADIVVNGMIAQHGAFMLPPGALRDGQLEHLSVEEVYEALVQQGHSLQLPMVDLMMVSGSSDDVDISAIQGEESDEQSFPGAGVRSQSQAELETLWRGAMEKAIAAAESSKTQGDVPAGLERELSVVERSQLDWRSYLWRYVVQTPTDFSGFDRRFVYRGLYLEALEGESVKVFVAVDTSGSIGADQLRSFLGEVQGIVAVYPHLQGELYYADAEVYGPYPLNTEEPLPKPVGGGGTSFVPFFERLEREPDWEGHSVCVYLTDGYGSFPVKAPGRSVLWVVTPGGLDLAQFPFGETVRLFTHDEHV